MTKNRTSAEMLEALGRGVGGTVAPVQRGRRPAAPAAESEEGWLTAVLECARWCGWLAYHTRDSRRSTPGFPDLMLVRPPRAIAAELKTDRGLLTREQGDWLAGLAGCGLEVYVWRPVDWPDVRRLLDPRHSGPI